MKVGNRTLVGLLLILVIAFGYEGGMYASAYMNETIQSIPFPESKYVNLLEGLQAAGYTFVLPSEICYLNSHGGIPNKTAMIVHYADVSLHGLPMFVSVETQLGIRSGIYPRADMDWFSRNVLYFQQLQAEGWEIGFTNDMLSEASGNVTQAKILFTAELAYMRMFFNVTTVRYHGDEFNNQIHNNLYMRPYYSGLGLCNVSDWGNATYIQDTHHDFIDSGVRTGFIALEIHTDWW